MSDIMELRPHQMNVAARIIYSGTALMAHEVGAGKTGAMAAAGMYMKRWGIAQKPLYVVPNHIVDQWTNEFLRFFPTANLLVTSDTDFTKQNRRRFVSKIAAGNYDGIIIGHSQFEKLALSRERQERLLHEEISSISDVIQKMKRDGGETWSVKQVVLFKMRLKKRLDKLLAADKKDDLLCFEELGVDYMFVDEAHEFKNCFTFTKLRNVAGISNSSSQKASDMKIKCQYLQEVHDGRGVTFATGTPVSNSLAELFVMQNYLQPRELQRQGLKYFDNWAATFATITSSLEITPEGSGYRMRTRFSKFHNLPELMNTFLLVADIQTSEMLNLPVPEIEGGKPNVIVTECTDFQKEVMASYIPRSEAIRKRRVKPEQDNMLKLTHEAKLMAIDPRLLYPDAPNDYNSKLNVCMREVLNTWCETKEKRLTQIVFCDSGTPKPDTFNVYDEMKSQLIQNGVPKAEIAFIHDCNSDAQRESLFEKVRNGDVRILFGSTPKLGMGTNVQDRLYAIHHVDVPWRPSDITQRNGRGLRQYNMNPSIKINLYVTKGTFDSYLWQIQEQKLRYISQIMTGKLITRSCDDIEETVLTAAEVKALATGNPMLAEKMEVDNEVTRLKILQANWQNEKVSLERESKSWILQTISDLEKRIENVKLDIADLSSKSGGDFSITLGGTEYTERPKAGDALMVLVRQAEKMSGQTSTIGCFMGFTIDVKPKGLYWTELRLYGNSSYSLSLGETGMSTIIKLENALKRIPDELKTHESDLVKARARLEEATKLAARPFEYEDRLREFSARQTEINTKLEFDQLNAERDSVIMDDEGEASYEDENVNDIEVQH